MGIFLNSKYLNFYIFSIIIAFVCFGCQNEELQTRSFKNGLRTIRHRQVYPAYLSLNDNETEPQITDNLYECLFFKKWANRVEDSFICVKSKNFYSCNEQSTENEFFFDLSSLNDTHTMEFINQEFLEYIKYKFFEFFTRQKNYSVVCAGVIYKEQTEIMFSVLTVNKSLPSTNIFNEEFMSHMRIPSAKTNEIKKKYKINTMSYYNKSENLNGTPKKTSHLTINNVLLHDGEYTFKLTLLTSQFNDSKLIKNTTEYRLFLQSLDAYFLSHITLINPTIVKFLSVLIYENFTLTILTDLFQANQVGFLKVGADINATTLSPFIYNNESISFRYATRLQNTILCRGDLLRDCPAHSFCYRAYSTSYCLCEPGYKFSNDTCLPAECPSNSCRKNEFCVYFLTNYYCYPRTSESDWIIATLIVAVACLALLICVIYNTYIIVYGFDEFYKEWMTRISRLRATFIV